MRKILGTTVLSLALAAGLAVPAQAHVTRFQTKGVGFIIGDGVKISGRIQCTPGEEFVVRVRVTQKSAQTGAETFRGFGTDKGNCNGSLQGWTVLTDDNTGVPQVGEATLTSRAFTELAGVIHGPIVKHQETIELQR